MSENLVQNSKSYAKILGIVALVLGIATIVLWVNFNNHDRKVRVRESDLKWMYNKLEEEEPQRPQDYPHETESKWYTAFGFDWEYNDKRFYSEEEAFEVYERDMANYEYLKKEHEKAEDKYQKLHEEYEPIIRTWKHGQRQARLVINIIVTVIEVLIIIAFVIFYSMWYKRKDIIINQRVNMYVTNYCEKSIDDLAYIDTKIITKELISESEKKEEYAIYGQCIGEDKFGADINAKFRCKCTVSILEETEVLAFDLDLQR